MHVRWRNLGYFVRAAGEIPQLRLGSGFGSDRQLDLAADQLAKILLGRFQGKFGWG